MSKKKLNNWKNYRYFYRNSHGHWCEATNPAFIAEHKDCIALHKVDNKKTIVKLLK